MLKDASEKLASLPVSMANGARISVAQHDEFRRLARLDASDHGSRAVAHLQALCEKQGVKWDETPGLISATDAQANRADPARLQTLGLIAIR